MRRMRQIVEDYTEKNTINIRDKIRRKLKNGYKVVAMSVTNMPDSYLYPAGALVVYEKEE